MKIVLIFLMAFLALPGLALAETELVRFTPDCEFTVTFPGKISVKMNKNNSDSPHGWQHVRDIDFLSQHHEISAICRPLDLRGREYELLMFYRNMEKEARRVQAAKPKIRVRQDRRNGIVLGEWKGYTRDYAKKPVTVEGRYFLGSHSKLLMLVATPGTHPEPAALVKGFFKSVRKK
jgi:hypothetical protein